MKHLPKTKNIFRKPTFWILLVLFSVVIGVLYAGSQLHVMYYNVFPNNEQKSINRAEKELSSAIPGSTIRKEVRGCYANRFALFGTGSRRHCARNTTLTYKDLSIFDAAETKLRESSWADITVRDSQGKAGYFQFAKKDKNDTLVCVSGYKHNTDLARKYDYDDFVIVINGPTENDCYPFKPAPS